MKNKFLLLVFLGLTLSNCNEKDELVESLDKLTTFDLDYEASQTMPAILPIFIDTPFPPIETPAIDTGNEAIYESNNTSKDLIESIKLTSMTLNINTPMGANFNFLRSIRIFIKAEGAPEVEIANLLDIENLDIITLELNTLDKELKDYLKEDLFTLSLLAVVDETTSEEYDLSIQSTFAVNAKILGI